MSRTAQLRLEGLEEQAGREAEEAGETAITYIRAIERTKGADGKQRDDWRADMAAQHAEHAARAARLAQGYLEGLVWE